MNDQPDSCTSQAALSELIAVLSDEELIRISYRLRKAGKSGCATLLTHELGMREFLAHHLPASMPLERP